MILGHRRFEGRTKLCGGVPFISRNTAGENKALDFATASQFQHVRYSRDVVLDHLLWIACVVCQRGNVVDHIDVKAFCKRFELIGLDKITLNPFRRVGWLAAGKASNIVASLGQLRDQFASDKPSASGDQHVRHRFHPFRV